MFSSPPVNVLIKGFFKHLGMGKVFAIRSKHPAKDGCTQRSSTAIHHEGDDSIPAEIPSDFPFISLTFRSNSSPRESGPEVSTNTISPAQSSWGESSARKASDMAQTFLPFVQAVAGSIPLVGAPMKATIGGLLEIFKAMDRRGQNKVDLDSLTSRLDRLHDDLCNAPRAQDHLERSRRKKLISMLLDTSATLTELRKRCLVYPSVTQDITGCFTKIDRYMAEYLVVFYSEDCWYSLILHLLVVIPNAKQR
ncbi:hypothetical protein EDB19DRAFT_1747213 [Suillus lakei]|nr:hypothetical protein EDB19DRAFT_1747213 [Suillus lakei]